MNRTVLVGGMDVSLFNLSKDVMLARAKARRARIRLAEDAFEVALAQEKADLAQDILAASKIGLFLSKECMDLAGRWK